MSSSVSPGDVGSKVSCGGPSPLPVTRASGGAHTSFFSSEPFLSSLASADAPNRPYRIGLYRTQGRLFRFLSVAGGAPITQRPFFDSVAAIDETPSGPVSELRYVPMAALAASEITMIPESVVEGPEFPAPYIDWTRFPTWEMFEAHFVARRSSLLRDSRQKRRHLERDLGALTFIGHDPRPEVFNQCLAWKSAQYVRTGRNDLFRDPRNVELFRTLAAKGALLISSLSAGETLLAAHFGGLTDDQVYSWVAAYGPELGRYSPGRLLLEDLLRYSYDRGHREFNFGIGHSDYKWHYASHSRTLGPLGEPPVTLVVRLRAKAAAKELLLRFPAVHVRVQRFRKAPVPVPVPVPVGAGADGPAVDRVVKAAVTEPVGVACQLEGFPAKLGTGGPSREEPWSWYLRRRAQGSVLRLRRELHRFARPGRPAPATAPKPPVAFPAADLKDGDWVRVRPPEYVRSTLDERGYLKGCGFSLGQYQYCGKELRVLRRVDCFFDEAQARMLKARNMVLLEGVHCDGSSVKWTNGCQRMCFYFWRTEWLEKIDGPRPPSPAPGPTR